MLLLVVFTDIHPWIYAPLKIINLNPLLEKLSKENDLKKFCCR